MPGRRHLAFRSLACSLCESNKCCVAPYPVSSSMYHHPPAPLPTSSCNKTAQQAFEKFLMLMLVVWCCCPCCGSRLQRLLCLLRYIAAAPGSQVLREFAAVQLLQPARAEAPSPVLSPWDNASRHPAHLHCAGSGPWGCSITPAVPPEYAA